MDTWRVVSNQPGRRVADTSRRRRLASPQAHILLVACCYGTAVFPTVGRVNSVVSLFMNFYTLGPFLFVGYFAGHSNTAKKKYKRKTEKIPWPTLF
jgi:hypothetical protein